MVVSEVVGVMIVVVVNVEGLAIIIIMVGIIVEMITALKKVVRVADVVFVI